MTGYFRTSRVNDKLNRGAHMNTFSKTLVAAAATAAFAMAGSASAAVYISFDGVTDAFVDLDDGAINQGFGALGGFASVLVQGNADTVGKGILHSTAVEVTAASTAANLTIWVTRTGLISDFKALFSSTNNNLDTGLTSTVEQFYSTSNQLRRHVAGCDHQDQLRLEQRRGCPGYPGRWPLLLDPEVHGHGDGG